TVTVTFTVAGEMTADERDCVEATPGNGAHNSATIDPNIGDDVTDDACVDIPDPALSITKDVVAGSLVFDADSGTWSLQYTVTVTNSGQAAGTYDLTDSPQFAPGVVIEGIAISGDATIADYTSGLLIVDDRELAAGDSHIYT